MSLLNSLLDGRPLVFIGAHPDDEILVSPLLALAADRSAAHVECVTAGQAGWNLLGPVPDRTLGQLRCEELSRACGILGASAHGLDYVNGNSMAHEAGIAVAEDEKAARARWKHSELPEKPEEVLARWSGANGPLAPRLRECIQARQDCVVVTFEPCKGFSEHREHCAVGLAVTSLFPPAGGEGSSGWNAQLYYVLHPDQVQPADERIVGSALVPYGHRNYVKTAMKAEAMHETQWGKRGSAKHQKYITPFLSVMETMSFRPIKKEEARKAHETMSC